MINVQNLNKNYGTTPAIKDVSFQIKQGEIVGFLGLNGAGKTTLMRILTGYLPFNSGKVFVAGHDMDHDHLLAKREIGYLPETPPLYPSMTTVEYLLFAGQLRGIARKYLQERTEEVLAQCDIGDVRHQPIGQLSKGYKQRVGIAQAIIHEPSILVLDEPTDGLDPRQILQVRHLLKRLEGRRTVILSTHILAEIEEIAQRIIILHKGKIVADDSLENLLKTADGPAQGHKRLEQLFLKITA